MPKLRSLLVAPASAGGLDTGGGQRTLLLYEALRRQGSVDVALIGARDRTDIDHPVMREARVQQIATDKLAPRATGRLKRMVQKAAKVARPTDIYTPDAALAARLSAMGGGQPYDVAAFRFFQTFAMGWRAGLARHACVDVDDRDDQKYATGIAAGLGDGALGRIVAGHVCSAVRATLEERLTEADRVWFVEPSDILPGLGPRASVVRNVAFNEPEGITEPGPAQTLLFIGAAGHPPNIEGLVWFLEQVWDRVRARVPEARLDIVGSGRWDDIVLPEKDGVARLGFVDSVSAAYDTCRAVICPISTGGGSKIKVLEAAAHARPIVCRQHSARGYSDGFRAALDIAEDPALYAEACIAHLKDREAAFAAGQRVRAAQQADHTREAVIADFSRDIAGLSGPEAGAS